MVTLDMSAIRGSKARRINVSFAPRSEPALSLPPASLRGPKSERSMWRVSAAQVEQAVPEVANPESLRWSIDCLRSVPLDA